MGAPKGNNYGIGNRGGGRKPAPVERERIEWSKKLWDVDQEIKRLEAKILTGVYSASDRYALMVLKGNEKLLKGLADKLVPDKIDVTSDGEKLVGWVTELIQEKNNPDEV